MSNLEWTIENDRRLMRSITAISGLLPTRDDPEVIYDIITEAVLSASQSRCLTLYRVNRQSNTLDAIRNYYYMNMGPSLMPDSDSVMTKYRMVEPSYPLNGTSLQAEIVRSGQECVIVGDESYDVSNKPGRLTPSQVEGKTENTSILLGKVSYFLPLGYPLPHIYQSNVIGILAGACTLEYADSACNWVPRCSTLLRLVAGIMVTLGDLEGHGLEDAEGEKQKEKPILSDREKEVLGIYITSLTQSQVADKLNVSQSTVSSHLSRIKLKIAKSMQVGAERIVFEDFKSFYESECKEGQ